MPEQKPSGFLTFTLHAHLPWVVNHGTWPHGLEWLLEAAAETYLPLLRMLGNLERDGVAIKCNLNLSPVLLEQLAHPLFQSEFPKYLQRKINAAREDESYFVYMDEHHFVYLARYWQRFFGETLEHFESMGRDIIAGFRRFRDAGLIDIITCGATHGYLPLLGTDESVRAQVRMAVKAHQRHIGSAPPGIWSPECGYRPAGEWEYPVKRADGCAIGPAFERIGIEEAMSESGLGFFFADTHIIQSAARQPSPYELMSGTLVPRREERMTHAAHRSLYQPYYVDGPYDGDKRYAVTVFPRDPKTGLQVWSGEYGYPGDPAYLDFHKKRWPGGHRYWSVTGAGVDMGAKQPYYPDKAEERIREHAIHFVSLVREALGAAANDAVPPVLSAPFDAELFGHWWFEGPQWLEAVARVMHESGQGLALISAREYLERWPRAGFLAMQEGSWGAEGKHQVWLNSETAWTWTQIYEAELALRDVCSSDTWAGDATRSRVVKQMCREVMLMESSDWQFLMTTGAARDYAELRLMTHSDQFHELQAMWTLLEGGNALSEQQSARLTDIETRDDLFPDIDPSLWALGARQQREAGAPTLNTGAEQSAEGVPSGLGNPALTEVKKFLSTDPV